jgi:putative ABC transport system substrate-binding protein
VKRREFITLLGGAAAAWPLVAHAQQSDRVRRVGILMPYPQTQQEIQERVRAFKEELHRLGWIEGSKIEFDERWTTDNMSWCAATPQASWSANPTPSSPPAAA